MIEAANGPVDVGDKIAFPGPEGQRFGIVDRIVTIRGFIGWPAKLGTEYRIYVHENGKLRWERQVRLRNPKRIVVLPLTIEDQVAAPPPASPYLPGWH